MWGTGVERILWCRGRASECGVEIFDKHGSWDHIFKQWPIYGGEIERKRNFIIVNKELKREKERNRRREIIIVDRLDRERQRKS